MNIFDSWFSSESKAVTFLNTHIAECKTCSNKKACGDLQTACGYFTVEDLTAIKENIATAWMVLFQLHSDKLANAQLKEAAKNFEQVFVEKSVKTLFLQELAPHCRKLTKNNDFSLLKKACRLFCVDNIQSIDREIVLCWVSLFEKYECQLDREVLGRAFADFHSVFTLQPNEVQKKLCVTCLGNQKIELPFVLLLPYRLFQKTLILNFETTAYATVEAFQKYLYQKELPQEACTSSDTFAQLVDIAREMQDHRLMDLCEVAIQSHSFDGTIGYACGMAIKGEKKLTMVEDMKDAKRFFFIASTNRQTDFLSHAALGQIAIQEKAYKEAMNCFQMALKCAPSRGEFLMLQVQALLGYIKQLERSVGGFVEEFVVLIKKEMLKEDIQADSKQLLAKVAEYIKQNTAFEKEALIVKTITECQQLADRNEFQSTHIQRVQRQLKECIANVMQVLLNQATELLQVQSTREIQANQILLEGEILYEKGDLKNAKLAFDSLFGLIKQNKTVFSKKETARLYYNLSQLYMANQRDKEAKEMLFEALTMDCENELVHRSLMLLESSKVLWYAPAFLKNNPLDTEVIYLYALALFNQGSLEEAKKQFLNANPYHAGVNYFLGKLEQDKKNEYFRRALTAALMDTLEFSYCLEIAYHFLESGTEQDWIALVELLSQLKCPETHAIEREQVLSQLHEKVKKKKIKKKSTEKKLIVEIGDLTISDKPELKSSMSSQLLKKPSEGCSKLRKISSTTKLLSRSSNKDKKSKESGGEKK